MSLLNIAPTKSNLLELGRQLAFAEEGYDLLEQKRQILVFELMSRLRRLQEVERRVADGMKRAHAAIRAATLDAGSVALDRAAAGLLLDHRVEVSDSRLMGLHLPHVTLTPDPSGPRLGPSGTPASADAAARRFAETLPALAEWAELQNAILRLSRELRKTQRRCNALLKIFIPDQRETIAYIRSALEEREREEFVILKMIRNRLRNAG